MNGKMEFTYSSHEKLIKKIVENGYQFASYHSYENLEKPCIMRHDVDYSLERAVNFAKKEKASAAGLAYGAIYFLLVSGDFYNVFSKDSLEKVYELLDMGFEIGLHFDETRYNFENDIVQYVSCVQDEIALMERALGIKVKAVSMHRPSEFTLNSNIQVPNVVNSYSEIFFKEFKYLSDSRLHWREDVMMHVENKSFDKLHILTHPFSYSDHFEGARSHLMQFIKEAGKDRYRILNKNFSKLEEFVDIHDI